jgi:hypothetical protein
VFHVAIVSESAHLTFSDLSEIGAAIQKQVSRDFAALWQIQATVDVFETQDRIPLDYWHVVISDDSDDPTAQGYHRTDHGQPFALVAFDDDCSINVSHEVLEMLADPFGSTMRASETVKDGGGRVQYLVEVCDPVQASSYTVNGIRVCDFYTPNYFDPVSGTGVRYSFSGRLTAPRQLLPGGYLTFFDPVSQNWFQQRWFDGTAPEIVNVSQEANLGTASLRRRAETPREMIDRITPSPRKTKSLTKRSVEVVRSDLPAIVAHARAIREQIRRLRKKLKK